MKETTILIQNLSTGYRNKKNVHEVTHHINATINSGELTCLLGTNGIGKSTLLRTLSAFLPPLGGKILIQGTSLTDYSDRQLSKLIGMVLTDRITLRNMTVEELVGMGRSPYTGFWGSLSKNDQKIVNESLLLVKIDKLKHRMVHTLSDGERQKVMIAKTLAQQTPIIFLDEPTAFLDFPSKVEIMKLLHYLACSIDKTIFMSTHDLELALQIADKIWLMDGETGVISGTPEDLAIDGSLSHFFSRKGIVFDMESGLFRIDNEFKDQIRLVGHGNRYAMVRKALQRNGILANRDVQSDTFIETGNLKTNGFIIHSAGKPPILTNTIEELLEQVL